MEYLELHWNSCSTWRAAKMDRAQQAAPCKLDMKRVTTGGIGSKDAALGSELCPVSR